MLVMLSPEISGLNPASYLSVLCARRSISLPLSIIPFDEIPLGPRDDKWNFS